MNRVGAAEIDESVSGGLPSPNRQSNPSFYMGNQFLG
jgi:hypothetical protein